MQILFGQEEKRRERNIEKEVREQKMRYIKISILKPLVLNPYVINHTNLFPQFPLFIYLK